MAFPRGWPPRACPSVRSIRFFVGDTSAANFSDKAYLFGTDPVTGAPTQAGNVSQMPDVPPGSTDPVSLGPTPVGGESPVRANDGAVPEGEIVAMRFAGNIQIHNDSSVAGDSIQISFDGINVHGVVLSGETITYWSRYEAGIAVRTTPTKGNCAFRIEAW